MARHAARPGLSRGARLGGWSSGLGGGVWGVVGPGLSLLTQFSYLVLGLLCVFFYVWVKKPTQPTEKMR